MEAARNEDPAVTRGAALASAQAPSSRRIHVLLRKEAVWPGSVCACVHVGVPARVQTHMHTQGGGCTHRAGQLGCPHCRLYRKAPINTERGLVLY